MKRKLYQLHKWCGLVAGIFILLLGISGAILVFHQELESLENRNFWYVENQSKVSIDKAYRNLVSLYPDYELRLSRFSHEPSNTLIFNLKKNEKSLLAIMHPTDGSILKLIDSNKAWVNWILNFHYSFQGGGLGKIAVFIAGLFFLTSLLTGLMIYRKSIFKVLLFRAPFRRGSGKAISSSLHRYIAVWALLLNFLLVITGLLISFDNISHHGQTKSGSISPMRISLDSALNIVHSRYPEFRPTYIRFPKESSKPLIINGKVEQASFYWTQYYNEIAVDLHNGYIYPLKLTSQGSFKTKVASVVGVIHLVEFDSFFVKMLFCLVGLSAPLLTITGFIIWRNKKR
jgi:uncharacterized iron-regulated membrane protein